MRLFMPAIIVGVFIGASANAGVVVGSEHKWPNLVIPYEYRGISPGEQRRVERAIDRWHTALGRVVFRRRVPTDQHIMVVKTAVNLPARICKASQAGFDANKEEVELEVQPSCSTNILVHELGHVLGLEHEHQRCDAEQFITVQYVTWLDLKITDDEARRRGSDLNLTSQFQPFQCASFLNRSGATTLPGPYDYLSVMHYDPALPLGCLASVRACVVFRLKADGRQMFSAPGRDPDEEWQLTREGADCEFTTRCITPRDVDTVRTLYGF